MEHDSDNDTIAVGINRTVGPNSGKTFQNPTQLVVDDSEQWRKGATLSRFYREEWEKYNKNRLPYRAVRQLIYSSKGAGTITYK